MAKFDDALVKLGKTFRYDGNPPTNESEYDLIKDGINDAPTWEEISNTMENLPSREDLKASAKSKLIAGEPLTEEEAATIVP